MPTTKNVKFTDSGSEEFAVCQNGRRIYIFPNDERGQRLRATHGNVNPHSLRAWQLLVAAGWTHIIDVGANYGEMLLNLDIHSPTELIAVEPNPRLARLLQHSLLEAGLNVRLYPLALSHSDGMAPLLVDATWSGLSRLGNELHPESQGHTIERIEVPTTTLKSLIDDGNEVSKKRVLVKVDVEGSECDVMRGLGNVLEQLDNFACLIEVLHLSQIEIDWLVENFQPEIFDPVTDGFVPVHGSGARLTHLLELGAFHKQDIILRRRIKSPA